jgi:D-alanyl-D-alanine carboxypeptidase
VASRRHRTRRAATCVGVVLLIAACGTGGAATASPTAAPSSSVIAPSPSPSPSPAKADAQGLLDAARATYGAPGALAVVRIGDERWFWTSGDADVSGTEIGAATRFRIASITKPIVAALVLDAVERSELSLDDVVADLVPDVLRAEPAITIRMLLDHTSGVFDEGNEGDPQRDVDALVDPALKAEAEDLVARYLAGEPVIAPDRLLVALAETHERYFAPGDGYHYSNINYQLAAMVVERATESPFAGLLTERVFEPLELSHTTVAPPDLRSPELRGYVRGTERQTLVDVSDDLVAFGNGGNGGIISTADELLTILHAIVAGDILDGSLLADMKRPTVQSGPSVYGLGLGTYELSCGTFFGHGGAVNGTVSIGLVEDEGTSGVVIAMNLQDGLDAGLRTLADRLVCR